MTMTSELDHSNSGNTSRPLVGVVRYAIDSFYLGRDVVVELNHIGDVDVPALSQFLEIFKEINLIADYLSHGCDRRVIASP